MAERTAPVVSPSEVEVIRSEETLQVGIAVRESGRVRISKRVVTEEQTITVTVRREELVVEELPAEPATAQADLTGVTGPDGRLLDLSSTGPVIDLVLHEEHVQTSTVIIPTERVRVHLTRVDGEASVGADLAREVVTAETTSPSLVSGRTASDLDDRR